MDIAEEYTVLPNSVARDRRLTPADKLIYSAVLGLGRAERGCYASDRYLAQRFGISQRSVSRSLQRLESLGLIYRTHSVGGRRRIHAVKR